MLGVGGIVSSHLLGTDMEIADYEDYANQGNWGLVSLKSSDNTRCLTRSDKDKLILVRQTLSCRHREEEEEKSFA